MNLFLQNLKYSLRKLGKNPASMLVIILTLAIGIAVNNVCISVINEFYFRPLPVHRPDQLVVVAQTGPAIPYQIPMSYADAVDFRSFVEGSDTVIPDMEKIFSGLMAYNQQVVDLGRSDGSLERIWVDAVTDNYFSVLGVQPHLGRFFRPEEVDAPGTKPVMVLSFATWRKQFDGDPKVIGSTVKLNSIVFTIIGVAKEEFMGASWGVNLNGFIPFTMMTKLDHGGKLQRGETSVFLMGRLRFGISVDQAQAACDVAYARLLKEYPDNYMPNSRTVVMRESHSRPTPYIAQHTPKIVTALTVMGVLVLLVALSNVAGLLYARSMNRECELAIRAAIGATRVQLMKQILTESVLLALAAGVLGTILSSLCGPGLMALMPNPDIAPPALDTGTDWRPFVATTVVALIVGLLAGLMPALKAGGIAPLVSMQKEGAGGIGGKNRWRSLMIAKQLIISILVLTVAALALRSTLMLANVDLGFQKENLHLVSFDLKTENYNMKRAREFHAELLHQVRALPGIESTSLTTAAPLSSRIGMLGGIRAENESRPDENQMSAVPTLSVEPGYLETIGMSLRSGRVFTIHDDKKAPSVAIINAVLAEILWPKQEAVGQRISIQGKGAEVIGIVGSKRYYNIQDTKRPLLITPLDQRYRRAVTLVVRTAPGVPSPMPLITGLVRELDPDLPLFGQQTIEHQIIASPNGLMPFRMGSILAGVQGAIALFLVGAGIFGQVAFSVARRTREIGIRIALGSSKRRVVYEVTRGIAVLTTISLIIGLGLAYGISRLLGNLIYGVGRGDFMLFGGVAVLIVATVILSCWLPTRRALRIDPMEALRCE